MVSAGTEKCYLDMTIHWGTSGYNHEENKYQHEFIQCCPCVSTQVTCWIEALELVSE